MRQCGIQGSRGEVRERCARLQHQRTRLDGVKPTISVFRVGMRDAFRDGLFGVGVGSRMEGVIDLGRNNAYKLVHYVQNALS